MLSSKCNRDAPVWVEGENPFKIWGNPKNKKAAFRRLSLFVKIDGGEGGIRTPGPLRVNGFQDRRYRPLSHLSVKKMEVFYHNPDWGSIAKMKNLVIVE